MNMKRLPLITLLGLLLFSPLLSVAQPGARPGAAGMKNPRIDGSMGKLFGQNKGFTAEMEIKTTQKGASDSMTIPGKLDFSDGKSRFEMNMAEAKGKALAGSAAQLKQMGMDKMISIDRPDTKETLVIYPGLGGYTNMKLEETGGSKSEDDYKVELTELDHETVDGHPCVKNKAVVSDKEGNRHESTVWNASDLNKFPVKIEQTDDDTLVTISFRNVKLVKPEATRFDPPSGLKKYDSLQAMMQEVMMKRFSSGTPGAPPAKK
jgi:hypothetical protein